MSGSFFIALVLTVIAALGGRDQLLVARIRAAGAQRGGMPLLVIGIACAVLTGALAAWAGGVVDAMISDAAETMLVAFALGLAGLELLWPNREKRLLEPTRSLGAIALVLLARQVSDGPRFVIFALAASSGAPLLTGVGGAAVAAVAIALGWSLGAALERLPLRPVRLALGAIILVAAIVIGLTARGVIG